MGGIAELHGAGQKRLGAEGVGLLRRVRDGHERNAAEDCIA